MGSCRFLAFLFQSVRHQAHRRQCAVHDQPMRDNQDAIRDYGRNRMKRRLFATLAVGAFAALALATPASANATAPTSGGNGAGQSGQCTGNPDDRPQVCPATD